MFWKNFQHDHDLQQVYTDFKLARNLFSSLNSLSPSEIKAIHQQLGRALQILEKELKNPPTPQMTFPDIPFSPGVRKAELSDLEFTAQLFDLYRQFYRLPSQLTQARAFIQERLEKGDSVIFLASSLKNPLKDPTPVGFVQLYPTWESLSGSRRWILNDLFVQPTFRGQGIGRRLLRQARALGEATGATQITLTTEKKNTPAQVLYQSENYQEDSEFISYYLDIL